MKTVEINSETLTVQQAPIAFSPTDKEAELRRLMREAGRVLVAYSGGVDSTYLAAVAKSELGENALCVTGLSPSVSRYQRDTASETAASLHLNFKTVNTRELDDANYRANGTDRCFFCKDELYTVLESEAAVFGSALIMDGTNADDLLDHRPGREAARRHGVRSPLAELGFTKNEIRSFSRKMNLPTAEMPASPCLSSRVATGVPVTIERLANIERAEEVLRGFGFREFRVRVHGDLARIEIAPEELTAFYDKGISGSVNDELARLGFRYVTLDLKGFRSGSMNS